MIILNSSVDKIQLTLDAPITSDELPYYVAWTDTGEHDYIPNQSNGLSNSATPVTIVDSPAESYKRTIKYINVYNKDTVSVSIKLDLVSNSTRTLVYLTLQSNERLEYTDTVGFRVLDSTGAIKTATTGAGGGSDGVNILAAGTQTAVTSGTVKFANSNGITFGMSNSTQITASHNGLTTAMASNAGSQFIYSSAGLNLTNISATLASNSISLSVGNYLTTAMASNRGSDFIQATASFAGTNATGTIASDGISVSVNAQSVVPQNVSLYGLGNTTQNSSTVLSVNALSLNAIGSLTVGYSNGSIQFSAPNALTTARASTDAVGLNTAGTNITWTVNSSGISINNSLLAGVGTSATNASITMNSNGLAISVATPTTLTSATLSDAATSVTLGRLAFTQSNGLTLSLSTSNNGNHTLIGSYTVPTVTNSSFSIQDSATTLNPVARIAFSTGNNITLSLSTGASSATVGVQHNLAGTSTGFGGNLISASMTHNSSGLNLSLNHPAWLTTADLSANSSKYIQNWKLTGNTAGTTSSVQGTDLWLAGGNGVTISGSSNTLSFSVATNYQSQGAYLTTAALSGDTTKYVQAWELTGNTAGTTSSIQGTKIYLEGGNNITVSGNSNTVKFSVGNYLTTARASTDAIGLNTAKTNVTWTVNSSGLSIDAAGYAGTGTTFNGANISGSITQNSIGLNLSLSVAAPGAAAENNWINLLGNNTLGNTTASGSTIGWSGDNNITLSAVNNSNVVIRGLSFANSNGITFGTNAGTLTASHNGITSQSNQDISFYALGNTIQNSSTVLNASKVSLNGLGELSVGFSNGSIQLSANIDAITAYAVSNTTQSSTGTLNIGSLSFAGAGVASVGVSNGSVVISVPSGGGGLTNVNISAGTTSQNLSNFVFSNSNGVSFGLNGSTITGSIPLNATISSWFEGNNNLTLLTAPGQGIASVVRFIVPQDVSATMFALPVYQSISSSAVNNTYGQQWSIYGMIATNDTANSRFMSLSSGSTQTTYTLASNNSGATQLIGSGVRPITVPINALFTPGTYHMIFNWSTNTFSSGTGTTALNRTVSMIGRGLMMSASYALVSAYDIATGVTNNVLWPQGCIAASNGIPTTVSHSTVTMTGASNSAANLAFYMRA